MHLDPAEIGDLFLRSMTSAALLDELLARCLPAIRAYAARLGADPADVEDIAQEVCERFLRNSTKIREPNGLVGWLFVVTKRVTMDVAKRSRAMVLQALPESVLFGLTPEEEVVDRNEAELTIYRVRRSLAAMKAADRVLLTMLFDTAASYQKISNDLDVPVGSIGPTRARLLRKLATIPEIARLKSTA